MRSSALTLHPRNLTWTSQYWTARRRPIGGRYGHVMAWLLAQMSDLHVTADRQLVAGVVDTTPYVKAAVPHLNWPDPPPHLGPPTGAPTPTAHAPPSPPPP